MPVAGKVYVVPLPEEKSWQLVVHNTGDRPFGLTQNILPGSNPDLVAHDDYHLYGHGLPVDPGGVSWQKFLAGDRYTHRDQNLLSHEIDATCYLRIGLRNLAFFTLKLPAMDEGPVEVDLADFNWYGSDPQSANPHVDRRYAGTRPRGSNAQDGAKILETVQALYLRTKTKGIRCDGSASVTVVRDLHGMLSHWNVRFENNGDQAFIGTCTLGGGQKNSGLGLEAMAVPYKGSAAVQRIQAYGDYGVEAVPGQRLRLGVRGYAWVEVGLPHEGVLEVPLAKFKLDTQQSAAEYFDRDAVLSKRNEKAAKVLFFDNGVAINAMLKPPVWTGDEARKRSTFAPPRLVVTTIEDCNALPGGGYRIDLESRLADFVDDERAGFIATIALTDGSTANEMQPRKLDYCGKTTSWFLPRGASLDGILVEPGALLRVTTKGLGWSAAVALPATGSIDSDRGDVWALREDHEVKGLLRQSYVQQFND